MPGSRGNRLSLFCAELRQRKANCYINEWVVTDGTLCGVSLGGVLGDRLCALLIVSRIRFRQEVGQPVIDKILERYVGLQGHSFRARGVLISSARCLVPSRWPLSARGVLISSARLFCWSQVGGI